MRGESVSLLTSSYEYFFKRVSAIRNENKKYYKYNDILRDAIERTLNTLNGRLIISSLPRVGKTTMAVCYLVPYILLRNPRSRILYVTYAGTLATQKSRMAKRIYLDLRENLISHGYSMDAINKDGADEWDLVEGGGGLCASGIDSGITGRGFDVILIDDTLKNASEARSPTVRENIWQEYIYTIKPRLENEGQIISIATRWHTDDLTGRMIEREKEENWDNVIIKAENAQGEFLDCPRSITELKKVKKQSPDVWQSLYQQDPLVGGGEVFKKDYFKYFSADEKTYQLSPVQVYNKDDLPIFFFSDTAVKDSKTSDYFAVLIACYTPDNNILVLDIIRKKSQVALWEQELKKLYAIYHPISIGVEDKVSGTVLIQSLKREGYPVFELKAKGSKIERSQPIRIFLKNGAVYFYKDMNLIKDFELELLRFPYGDHDDMVDCFSYCGIHKQSTIGKSAYEAMLEAHKEML